MLIEFRVKNHRSMRDEQVLTMQAGPLGEKTDPRPLAVAGFSERLVPVAAIYGANASGKSNLLSALAYMRDAVQNSHRIWPPEGGVPRKPFAWGQSQSEASMFEVTVLISGVKYQYGFAVSSTRILEEWLFAWPRGHQQKWFERDGQTLKFGAQLKGENKAIQEFTRENALFLSVAAQNNHTQLKPIFNWFQSLESVNVSTNSRGPIGGRNQELFPAFALDDEEKLAEQNDLAPKARSIVRGFKRHVGDLLKNSDLGVLDIRSISNGALHGLSESQPQIELRHRCTSENAWLPLEEESNGTRTLFRLAWPLYTTIREGGLLLVDELEASLHPSLAEQIVRQFQDPKTNPQHAQLIFTTQDTNLLGSTNEEAVLRRDQIWLTEKDSEGATTLFPLTDFKPRKSENLERGYLQGRYGAIPFLGNFSFGSE
jgi:AAA15 family ATPase/GTPase